MNEAFEGNLEDYVGTACWSSPETLGDGPLTSKSDIFSFGLVLWEMIALTPPHVAPLSDSDTSFNLNDELYGNQYFYLIKFYFVNAA